MVVLDEKLTPKQESLLVALLSEKTAIDAAKKVGIGETTMHRWLKLPGFQNAFRQARRAIVEAAIARLQNVASEAAEALQRNLTCGIAASEIRAALGVLDHAVKGIELADLTQRVEEMERFVKELASEGH